MAAPNQWLMADALGTPDPELLWQAGYRGFAGYLGRNLTRSYVQRLQARGHFILPIYEEDGTPGNANGIPEPSDFADGARQGRIANSLIASIPELFGYGCAFTDDVSRASYEEVREWVKGIRSTFLGPIIYYGPAHYGDRLFTEGLIAAVWVEGAWGFSPGYNPRNPQPPHCEHACGWQFPLQPKIGGVPVDYNEFYTFPWLPGHGPQEVHPLADLSDNDVQRIGGAFADALLRDDVQEALSGSNLFWIGGGGQAQNPEKYPDISNIGSVVQAVKANTAAVQELIDILKPPA